MTETSRATLSQSDHKIRSRGIGSSEIAALVGQNPWQGPHQLWLRKTGRLDKFEPTERMVAGQFLEPAIIAMYEHKMGCRVSKPPTKLSEKHEYVVDSIDGIATLDDGRTVGIEAKSTHWRNVDAWGEEWSDEIPGYYLTQCIWHCGVHELGECHVPVWNGESFRVYRVLHDAELFDGMVKIAQVFWRDYVLADVEPALDGKLCTRDYVSRQGMESKEIRQASDEIALCMSERDKLDKAIKELKYEKETLENKIRQAIGSAYGIESAEYKATWPESRGRESLDIKALVELVGITDEQLAQCTKRGASYRRLAIKKKRN